MKKNVIIAVMAMVLIFLIYDKIKRSINPTRQQSEFAETKKVNETGVYLDQENPAIIWEGKDSTSFAKKDIVPTHKLENTLNPETQKYIQEHILPELKTASQSVESISKISAVASGEIATATIILPDNTKVKISKAEKISFKDKYAEILIEKDSTGKILPAKYKFNTDFYAIKTKSKPILFWQKDQEEQVFTFTNPHIDITNVENFTQKIEPRKTFLQVKLNSGMQVGFKNPAHSNFSAGFSAVFNQDNFLSPEIGVGKIWSLSDGSADNYGRIQLNVNVFKLKK